jgi:hypothetical protein
MPYTPSRDGRQRRARAERDPVVPETLDELHGQSIGVLEIPHHMSSGHRSARRFDLADPAQQRLAYQRVLCSAANCAEVDELINAALLRRIWSHLHLPRQVRDAWHDKHPELAGS